jgi:hypothetical protein
MPLNTPDTKPRRRISAKMFIASLFADPLLPECQPPRVGGLLRKEFDISLWYHRLTIQD